VSSIHNVVNMANI